MTRKGPATDALSRRKHGFDSRRARNDFKELAFQDLGSVHPVSIPFLTCQRDRSGDIGDLDADIGGAFATWERSTAGVSGPASTLTTW